MKLVKARIRSTGKLRESQWFEVSPQLNLFQFPGAKGPEQGRNFLRILQTINPPYAVRTRDPFADLPGSIDQDGHTRRINPAKRTVALAVFNAPPTLVRKLTSIGEWFYETDRIEVGRRLDYSRWINFVELASSTRWSEISSEIEELSTKSSRIAPESSVPPSDLHTLKPTDRIIGQLPDTLVRWLHTLPQEMQKNCRQLIEETDTKIMRAVHFQTARDIVRTRLPLFVVLGTDPELLSVDSLLQLISQRAHAGKEQSPGEARLFLDKLNEQLADLQFSGIRLQLEQITADLAHLSLLQQMQAKAALAIAYSRIVCQSEPILLFAGPERQLPVDLHPELADFILDVSATCQCLCCYGEVNVFPINRAQKHYNGAEDSLVPMPVDERLRT